MKRAVQSLLLCALCAVSNDASAHLVSTRFGELYSGMLHPLITLQHVVPWVALGLLGGLQATSSARRLMWVMPVSVMLGVFLGSLLPELRLVTLANILSFVVLGGLVAAAARLEGTVLTGIAATLGLSHGLANATPELSGGGQALYVLGVGISAYLLTTLITAGAHVLSQQAKWGNIALRAAGSWVVAIGLIFGGFSLVSAP